MLNQNGNFIFVALVNFFTTTLLSVTPSLSRSEVFTRFLLYKYIEHRSKDNNFYQTVGSIQNLVLELK